MSDDERMVSSRSAPPYKQSVKLEMDKTVLPILYRSYKKIFFHRTISRTPVANSSFNEQSIMRMRTHSRTGPSGVI